MTRQPENKENAEPKISKDELIGVERKWPSSNRRFGPLADEAGSPNHR